MEKRIILAAVLSILVMAFYAHLIERFYPKTRIPLHRNSGQVSMKPDLNFKEETSKQLSKELPLNIEAKKEVIENKKLRLIVNNIGGSIEGILLRDKKFDGSQIIKDALFEKGILSFNSDVIKNGAYLDFEIKKVNGSTVLSKEVEGLRIEKGFSLLDEKSGILAEIVFKNFKEKPIDLNYKINLGTQISEPSTQKGFFEIAIASPAKVYRIYAHNIRNSKELYQSDIDWVAIKDRFYSLVARPQDVPILGLEISGKPPDTTIFLKTQNFTILPGQEVIHRYILYAGPNSLKELKEFGYGIENSLSLGMFSSIAQILLTILNLFYKIFKNYGISIILLSLLINLFLFPLTLKSLKSMRQLQEIQPQINRLRDEFKDNPQRLNKELMELYKRHKVNPFGGCLPMLLQMPVFLALYQAFMRSAELKGQGFLWIKDLSGPDVLYKLNFKLPILGNTLNLLPILMIFAMFFQQRLSSSGISSEQTEQQRILTFMMPIMFGIIFYNLPAGLVLYWITSTILSSALQFAIVKRKG